MIALFSKHPFFVDKEMESCLLLQKQGHCNRVYFVLAGGVKYIVRKLLRDDVDRELEWKVQNLAFLKGITAEPLYFDRKENLMVFAFLEAIHKELLDKKYLLALASTLKTLHYIHIGAKPITLEIENKTDVVLEALDTIKKYKKELVLCHNDLTPHNIFFSPNIKLIDFEYAGINDRYFDLASICIEFKLKEDMQKLFMEAYFEGDYNLEKLEAYKIIYKTLCKEWFAKNL
ncbi:Choline kinase [hydrothermal vent metagenome]|uniref:Choline kinase n=1 Tax=hydrothermal vent metagenome TaxID=652676 RepID=A0A1W1CBQ0_9ZZZZ